MMLSRGGQILGSLPLDIVLPGSHCQVLLPTSLANILLGQKKISTKNTLAYFCKYKRQKVLQH
jgi:hypothetical protein